MNYDARNDDGAYYPRDHGKVPPVYPRPAEAPTMSETTFTFSDAPAIYRDRSADHVVSAVCLSADHLRHARRISRDQYRYLRAMRIGPLTARAAIAGQLLTRGYPVTVSVVDHTER